MQQQYETWDQTYAVYLYILALLISNPKYTISNSRQGLIELICDGQFMFMVRCSVLRSIQKHIGKAAFYFLWMAFMSLFQNTNNLCPDFPIAICCKLYVVSFPITDAISTVKSARLYGPIGRNMCAQLELVAQSFYGLSSKVSRRLCHPINKSEQYFFMQKRESGDSNQCLPQRASPI